MVDLAIKCIGTGLLIVSLCSWAHGENVPSTLISEQPHTTFHHPKPRLLDGFGMSVVQHHSQVLIGAPHAMHQGQETGSAYLFDLHGKLVHEFVIPRVMPGALFGQAVALSQQSVIIGAPYGRDTLKTQTGVTYIFDRVTNKARLTLNNPQPISGVFGHALAVDDSRVLVGDPQASTLTLFHIGAAYLFDETTGALQQTFRPHLGTVKRSTQFGHAVALVGGRVFVSAPLGGLNDSDSGMVYLFDGQTGDLVRTFQPPTSLRSSLFGWSFAANEQVILIGAFGFQETYREEGMAYLFDIHSGKLLVTLKNPNPTERARFGHSVVLLSNSLVVAAPGERIQKSGKIEGGAIYLFNQVSGKLVQTLRDPLQLTGASDVFGHTIFSHEDALFVGAPFGGVGKELDAGIAYHYVFQALGSSSVNLPTLTAP